MEWKKKGIKREVICIVPSFEYFGRLYDLLPWILHECSHQVRILDRSERNAFIADYILDSIFSEVIEDLFQSLAGDKLYTALGLEERELVRALVEEAKRQIFDGGQAAGMTFEQIAEHITIFLMRLFGNNGKYLVVQRTDEEIRNVVRDSLLEIYRGEGLWNNDKLALLKKISDGEGIPEIEDEIPVLLERYKKKICNRMQEKEKGVGDNIWIDVEDFEQPILWLEARMKVLAGKLREKGVSESVINEYYFEVKQLYRVYGLMYTKAKTGENENDKKAASFFEKVYGNYWEGKKENLSLIDPTVMYIMRNIGLVNGSKITFGEKMTDMFRKMDGQRIQERINQRIKIYHEAGADLLMVAALNMNSFGYCRQVLQTVADAKTELEEYEYGDANFERFRIVIAALLMNENNNREECGDGEIKIDVGRLLERAQSYCENMLKSIKKQIGKKDKYIEDKMNEFLECMKEQLAICMGKMGEREYKETFLFLLLHDNHKDTSEETLEGWNQYKDIVNYFTKYKYSFWRLEVFCRGLTNIMWGGKICVNKDFLVHMKRKLDINSSMNRKEGIWKQGFAEELMNPNLDVGDYYNDPASILLKSKAEKLENTIDFIQNYYYSNRFRIIKDFEEKKGDMNDGGKHRS